MWGDPRTTPGGLAKNFSYFTRVEVKKDEWLKDGKQAVGQTIKGRTIKNKTYKPQQQAVVDFYFADSVGFNMGSFDTVKDVVNIAITCDLITRAGAFYSYGDQKWQGKDKLLAGVREDLDLQEDLKATVTHMAFADHGQ
jgi:recombination protein RecA